MKLAMRSLPRLAPRTFEASSGMPWLALVPVAACSASVSMLLCDEGSATTSGQPRAPMGRWRLDSSQSEWLVILANCRSKRTENATPPTQSMRPYLMGLGLPGFVAGIIDRIPVDLNISVEEGVLTVKDKTFFGENCTVITLGGAEVERETRNKRKKFMLSAFEDLSNGSPQLTVQCRLFQRGDGWRSLQSFKVQEGTLQERYILKRPDSDDIVVTRVFKDLNSPKIPKGEQDLCQHTFGSYRLLTGVGIFAVLASASICFVLTRSE
ncbi:unnamed protein product [Durusdinium trenchii]|uniref:Uncharacterized protein n=2 Tax=Durusdinium trenchii TaxID=1381693 RepID=A0ABP0SRX7_9DINO